RRRTSRGNDAKYWSRYPPSFERCLVWLAALLPPAGRAPDLDEHGRGVRRGGHHQRRCVVLWIRSIAAAPAALGKLLDLIRSPAKHRHLQYTRRYGAL